jgi:DHA1 family bicyclomycin/chloramphenicol resistance-like MFS transporter
MTTSYFKNALVLGLLSALGPLAVDMYLPALPIITADLGTTAAATQLTLTLYFVAFGICQLVYGPWSDQVGRKPPLYVGLALFTAGSIGCALAPSVGWLIAFRFLQGLGAAAIAVMPRAVVRDLHTGVEATRLMALVMLVFSVSPMLAPLAGSALIVPFGWRSTFAAVTLAAVLGLVLVAFALPETRLPQDRIRLSVGGLLRSFARLARDRQFLGLTLIGGLGMASFFTFLASSSFVYIGHYGLTPTQYSLAFALNAFGFIGTSQFAGFLGRRFGLPRLVLSAVMAYAALALLLLLLTLSGIDHLAVLMGMLFVTYGCLGLVIPTTMVLALEDYGDISGVASGFAGTLQMLTGGAVIGIGSLVADGSSTPMVVTIATLAVAVLAVTLGTLRHRATAPQLAE